MSPYCQQIAALCLFVVPTVSGFLLFDSLGGIPKDSFYEPVSKDPQCLDDYQDKHPQENPRCVLHHGLNIYPPCKPYNTSGYPVENANPGCHRCQERYAYPQLLQKSPKLFHTFVLLIRFVLFSTHMKLFILIE